MSTGPLSLFFLTLGCGSEDPAPSTPMLPPPEALPNLADLPPMPPDAVVSERLSKDNGFRSAQMGKARQEFDDLQRRKKWDDKELGLRAYAKKSEYLLVGAATVERIVYRFYDEQLFSVELLSEDLIHCSTLKEVLTEMYGEGRRSKTGFTQRAWWGDDVTLLLTDMGDCSAEYTWRSKHRELVVGALPKVSDTPAPSEGGAEAEASSAPE